MLHDPVMGQQKNTCVYIACWILAGMSKHDQCGGSVKVGRLEGWRCIQLGWNIKLLPLCCAGEEAAGV